VARICAIERITDGWGTESPWGSFCALCFRTKTFI
jgi:hypothetical protein